MLTDDKCSSIKVQSRILMIRGRKVLISGFILYRDNILYISFMSKRRFQNFRKMYLLYIHNHSTQLMQWKATHKRGNYPSSELPMTVNFYDLIKIMAASMVEA